MTLILIHRIGARFPTAGVGPVARPYDTFVPGRQGPVAVSADSAGLCGRLPGREGGRFGMSWLVVPRQDLAEGPGPAGEAAGTPVLITSRIGCPVTVTLPSWRPRTPRDTGEDYRSVAGEQ